MNTESSRKKDIDIARGIAILCIIIGHLGRPAINTINRVVFTFHVPIFFLISGFFFSEEGDILPFIKKKLKCLNLLVQMSRKS